MRIRTDGDKEYRKDVIEQAAELYDCNKTDAVVYACDDVAAVARGVREILERDDLTARQKREIAMTFETNGMTVEIDETLSVELG